MSTLTDSFRELFLVTFHDHRGLFLATAGNLERLVAELDEMPEGKEKTAAWFKAKVEALDMLTPYDEFLFRIFYNRPYGLTEEDMLAVGEKLQQEFSPFDKMTDTRYGNEVFSLRYGVVIASMIGKNYLFGAIREECPMCERYLRSVYPVVIKIDITGLQDHPEVAKYTREFGCTAHNLGDICWKKIEELDSSIQRIPQDEHYFAKHIFANGLTEFPGVAFELQFLKEELCSGH